MHSAATPRRVDLTPLSYSMQHAPLLVELCLTLPAQLSSLLPLLPQLMRPLVLALKGTEALAALGMRTLECWVDSLNPEFLEPAMSEVVSEVMPALWALLKPQGVGGSLPLALMSMTLLGKLGEWCGSARRRDGLG